MATVNKDFKIKSGLIVEGTTATVNGYDILTKKPADDQYIIDLIGGETLVKSVSGNLSVDGAGDLSIDQEGLFDTLVSDGLATTTDISDAISTEVTNRNSAISTAKGEAIADAGTYTDAEITTALTTAQGYADDAETAANSYTDGRETAITSAYQTYADTAETDAKAYTDTRETAITTAYQSYADTAEQDAKNYADDLINDASNLSTEVWSAYKTSTEIGLAQGAAEDYADTAIANLVDSAPSTLNTLNELAAALQDNPDIITDLQDIAAGKQDTLTAGNGIDITGDTISVAFDAGNGLAINGVNLTVDTNVISTKTYAAGVADDAEAAANTYTDGEITTALSTAQGYANTAEQNAKDYADALDTDDVAEGETNLYFTNQRAIDAVGGTIGDQIDLLTTDDIEEGETNLYFEDGRAKDSAGDLLAGATTENVVITYTGGVLSITAENGVADSDTDDLAEGSTNLYFQDSRALGAISGSNIQPESIDITWVRREEATWTDVATASKATCHSAGTSEGSMKYLVRVTASVGGTRHSHVTEVLATVDGGNGVAVVEYGTIYTSAEPLATVTVEWNASTSKYDLNVTTANNSSEVMVAATLMATLD
jgi:hypothetical protein